MNLHPIAFVLALICGVCARQAPAAEPATSVPGFAKIAGFRVGLDTIEKLEHRFGRGVSVRGGHPNGARSWSPSPKRPGLYADGFNSFDRKGVSYAGGRQIDCFGLYAAEGSAGGKFSDEFKFMGRVALGATKEDARKLLAPLLPAPEERDGSFVWSAKGLVRVSHANVTTEWKACLHFEKGRLDRIEISTLN